MSSYGNFQTNGTLRLTGTSGILDERYIQLGIATAGKPKTFFGYTVTGDTIVSFSEDVSTSAAAFDNFTYGSVVPEPSFYTTSMCVLGLGLAILLTKKLKPGFTSE